MIMELPRDRIAVWTVFRCYISTPIFFIVDMYNINQYRGLPLIYLLVSTEVHGLRSLV
jgi:hypothetical protein